MSDTTPTSNECIVTPKGTTCLAPGSPQLCSPWDFVAQQPDQCYADGLTQEALAIAGANINVYKLLGVHEQTKLVDLTGNGTPISSGDAPNFPVINAFTTFATEWRSKQIGIAVTQSAFLGYDFGYIKLPNGRERYGIDTSIRHEITTIKIKQSSIAIQRITKARVERSDNGAQWYGVAVINLPDNDTLNEINFKNSVPCRYWRLRPLTFNGGATDAWGVQALELMDYSVTQLNNIQDKIFLENRDRDYDNQPTLLKGYYDLINISADLKKFGIEIPTSAYQIKVNFNACVGLLGRPLVIGDIIELPSETQFTPALKPIKRYQEVTDVTWDAASYTPGWHPTLLLVTTQPAMATQETQDIFGDLGKTIDSSGLFSNDDGNNPVYQDYSTVDQTIKNDALTATPERGADGTGTLREFTPEEVATAASEGFPHLSRIGLNPKGLYVEDGMPPNGLSFTEGPVFPTSPINGDYHRLTFVGLSKNVPVRLYRYSTVKGRWIFLEVDRREQFNFQREVLDEYLTSTTRKPAKDIK